MNDKKFQTIYQVEALTHDGNLVARYYAANKKTAASIVNNRLAAPVLSVSVRLLNKDEHYWVNPEDVERI